MAKLLLSTDQLKVLAVKQYIWIEKRRVCQVDEDKKQQPGIHYDLKYTTLFASWQHSNQIIQKAIIISAVHHRSACSDLSARTVSPR